MKLSDIDLAVPICYQINILFHQKKANVTTILIILVTKSLQINTATKSSDLCTRKAMQFLQTASTPRIPTLPLQQTFSNWIEDQTFLEHAFYPPVFWLVFRQQGLQIHPLFQ